MRSTSLTGALMGVKDDEGVKVVVKEGDSQRRDPL
jgi:hypothetical protein